jgi:4-diphosphocytidyl-2-C-methyl-D-erythritol kinase
MVLFPHCKINIGLHILEMRPDGYHGLQTIFYPMKLYDVAEIIESEDFSLSMTGLKIPGLPDQNLCIRAYQILKKKFPELPPVSMHLHKHIPTGSGLGGGSSDGAFMLKMLNEKFALRLSIGELSKLAIELGSDCPYFLHEGACYAEGRGELLEPISLDLSSYCIALVHSGVQVSTRWAFSLIKVSNSASPIKEIIKLPIYSWKSALTNDFEAPVFSEFPALQKIKDSLYKQGAYYSSLTGSGSTIYGIFDKDPNLKIELEQEFRVDLLNG